MPDKLTMTKAWYQRLGAFGHGQAQQGSADDALAVARDGTAGTLVGANEER
jgi:hypothetical protein